MWSPALLARSTTRHVRKVSQWVYAAARVARCSLLAGRPSKKCVIITTAQALCVIHFRAHVIPTLTTCRASRSSGNWTENLFPHKPRKGMQANHDRFVNNISGISAMRLWRKGRLLRQSESGGQVSCNNFVFCRCQSDVKTQTPCCRHSGVLYMCTSTRLLPNFVPLSPYFSAMCESGSFYFKLLPR
jgi:hypothetical protein